MTPTQHGALAVGDREATAAFAVPERLGVRQRGWRRLHDLRERIRPAPTLGVAWAPTATGQAADDLLFDRLSAGTPSMIARLGAGELEAVLRQLSIADSRHALRHRWRYVMGNEPAPWWDAPFLRAMELHTGFFPATPRMLERFAARVLDDLPLVDILGSWLPGEPSLAAHGLRATRVPLADLEPYFHARPWSRVLRDRVVLIVHPLADLIRQQLQRREALFPGRDVLPPFEVRTVRAVVSNAGSRPPYGDWFAALDAMQEEIARQRFDVAIIGAGAYGFSLAAAVKRLGRHAVHLGGASQILFGIRGKRWDDMPSVAQLFNSAWVYPHADSRPPRWQEIERGCYW